MNPKTRLIVLVVSAPIIAFAVVGGFLSKALARENAYQHLRVFEDVVQLILNNYVEPVEPDRVMKGAMRGLAEGLDPDSAYLTAAQVKELESGDAVFKAAGEVGIQLTRQYYLRVIATRDGSPAQVAGIRPGDYVRAIDGRPTREMSVFEGTRLLHGASGTKVTLTILRGSATEPHDVALSRVKSDGPPVTARAMPNGVGYVRIAAFDGTAAESVRKQAQALHRGGTRALVVDVRNCAEGELANGLAVARLFVGAGTLAIREMKGGQREPVEAANQKDAKGGTEPIAMPLAVLVDNGTSGAAELFASAVAENHKAELIGEHTHGRAATQKLVRLPDGSGLWLSTVRYLTAAAKPIHEHGLVPQVEAEQPDVEFGGTPPTDDPILTKALERLKARG
ncbi:MAG: PDZ domain-containing protein [Acidobacteria bacterium]|nr:PDZ domain-containing protein [Acidobacteriota bacterium]